MLRILHKNIGNDLQSLPISDISKGYLKNQVILFTYSNAQPLSQQNEQLQRANQVSYKLKSGDKPSLTNSLANSFDLDISS